MTLIKLNDIIIMYKHIATHTQTQAHTHIIYLYIAVILHNNFYRKFKIAIATESYKYIMQHTDSDSLL